MANRFSLKAKGRATIGRKGAKATRTTGAVPAILYGGGSSQPLQLDKVELANALNASSSEHALVDLEIEDNGSSKKSLALVKEVQHHPTKDTVLHIDFHEVDENRKLRVEVPVVPKGEAAGVKTSGGLLDQAVRLLELECLPKDLPDKITVDVTGLELNQALHVGEISLPEGVRALNPKDLAVFIVHEPKVSEEAVEAEAAAPTEPEVIGEKKEEKAEKAEDVDKKPEEKKEEKKK